MKCIRKRIQLLLRHGAQQEPLVSVEWRIQIIDRQSLFLRDPLFAVQFENAAPVCAVLQFNDVAPAQARFSAGNLYLRPFLAIHPHQQITAVQIVSKLTVRQNRTHVLIHHFDSDDAVHRAVAQNQRDGIRQSGRQARLRRAAPAAVVLRINRILRVFRRRIRAGQVIAVWRILAEPIADAPPRVGRNVHRLDQLDGRTFQQQVGVLVDCIDGRVEVTDMKSCFR